MASVPLQVRVGIVRAAAGFQPSDVIEVPRPCLILQDIGVMSLAAAWRYTRGFNSAMLPVLQAAPVPLDWAMIFDADEPLDIGLPIYPRKPRPAKGRVS